jgi:putative oxidoreductase
VRQNSRGNAPGKPAHASVKANGLNRGGAVLHPVDAGLSGTHENGGDIMPSSHPALSKADDFAASSADISLLIGRVLLGLLFLFFGWSKLNGLGGFQTYLTNLGVPASSVGILSVLGACAEFIIGVTLVLGLATRYGALLCIVFLAIAVALAHRYWEYPAAQQMAQYMNFMKGLSIMGGAFLLFVTGPGRFSVDAALAKR